ncbi:MAG: hypothetical protein NZ850_08190, partial [Caldimicrobium sp.]|nr:hypothetical protein [Caldimicrobium sp.]
FNWSKKGRRVRESSEACLEAMFKDTLQDGRRGCVKNGGTEGRFNLGGRDRAKREGDVIFL